VKQDRISNTVTVLAAIAIFSSFIMIYPKETAARGVICLHRFLHVSVVLKEMLLNAMLTIVLVHPDAAVATTPLRFHFLNFVNV
jgi:hypothetical protein